MSEAGGKEQRWRQTAVHCKWGGSHHDDWKVHHHRYKKVWTVKTSITETAKFRPSMYFLTMLWSSMSLRNRDSWKPSVRFKGVCFAAVCVLSNSKHTWHVFLRADVRIDAKNNSSPWDAFCTEAGEGPNQAKTVQQEAKVSTNRKKLAGLRHTEATQTNCPRVRVEKCTRLQSTREQRLMGSRWNQS